MEHEVFQETSFFTKATKAQQQISKPGIEDKHRCRSHKLPVDFKFAFIYEHPSLLGVYFKKNAICTFLMEPLLFTLVYLHSNKYADKQSKGRRDANYQDNLKVKNKNKQIFFFFKSPENHKITNDRTENKSKGK